MVAGWPLMAGQGHCLRPPATGRDKEEKRMRQPCWRHSDTRGGTAVGDKGRGAGFAQFHADTGMSRARHERHRRVPDDSEHQVEQGFHCSVCNDKNNTTKQESLKDSKLCRVRFSENQRHRRCLMK